MKIIHCLSFLLLTTLSAFAQDRIYLTKDNKPTTVKENAVYYQTLENDNGLIKEATYLMNDRLSHIKRYSDYNKKIMEGEEEFWTEDGKLYYKHYNKNNEWEGQQLWYYENGKVKRNEIYKDGKFISGKCFDNSGIEIPYFPFEKIPEYSGGVSAVSKYIAANFRGESPVSGKIIVNFIIDTDGSVTDIEIVRGINKQLNDEAIRVISKMAKWTPGMQDGKPVRVKYSLPISIARSE